MEHLFAIGITVLAVTALIVMSRHSPVQTVDGVRWLKHGAALRAVGAFGITMPIYVMLDGLNASRPQMALILGIAFTAIGLPLFLSAFFWKIGYDSAGIYCLSPWRKRRFVPWSHITELSFSQTMKQWVVHTAKLGTIRVNVLVPGSSQLVDELARRGFKANCPPR